MPRVLIVGGGFAGLNLAKGLGDVPGVEVLVVDRTNHHLFQPLLYQVAMAGLSPADIAAPIRSLLARFNNIRVLQGEVRSVDTDRNLVVTDFGELPFDYLVLACGARHSYFGHDEWEEFAPGLKTLEQATEIRRRVLSAYESAERTTSLEERKRLLTFVVVGGGPTGVELAGAIGEMSRFTLAKDFRNIDATLARVILLEAGPRILGMFSEQLSARAARDLEQLGVQIWTGSAVTKIDANGVDIGNERIISATVLWAAGVKASSLGKDSGFEVDRSGRVIVENDLSVKGHPNIFVAGDQSCYTHQTGRPLPGTAPVAMQQGCYLANLIRIDVQGGKRTPFRFADKGQMATIGRSRAVVEVGKFKMTGFIAWMAWLLVHIYYLTGFPNRLRVVLNWGWSYITFRRGARLIVPKEWRFGQAAEERPKVATVPEAPVKVSA
ncbi:NAD(P)/FAD-dependent oxidoreductase [Schlesneria paludicola]|uniref:NAD(P)/FAD-dependent oxidoreductase n=1 Tax=Schlesneria paludicola TaxID=360056 RepID=UPI00029AF383|nr:NAD(P)/FAD-dependent oxidoreductase [Schlesneria paludicola]